MDKKVISLIGLGVLVASGLLKENDKITRSTRSSEEHNDNDQELIVPGIATNEFISERYKIAFRYPKSWNKNPRYADKYEGTTGFFEVSDFSGVGENIDEVVNTQINEAYKPYGSNPTVRNFMVDGQPARVIYPSADQSEFFEDREEALVVQYKEPNVIDGIPYKYVVIWATKEYMPLIISSFRFIEE